MQPVATASGTPGERAAVEAAPAKVHFHGLDSLRFWAALFVIIGHIPMNQDSVGLPSPSYGALFFRGAPAVSFFFTLSGFLITYLLLAELRRTGGVHVGSFYLRRVCRIWPLYFLIVGFGLFFYNALLPRLHIPYKIEYTIPFALLLYSFFLPNLMNSLYTVGGILNPLWSIGVEEQFYLFWAPAVKRFHARLPRVCWIVLGLSLIGFCLNHFGLLGTGRSWKFFSQLKFHFMAAGGLCAVWLHRKRDTLLSLPVFTNRFLQIALFAVLLDFYLADFAGWGWFSEEIVQIVLYSWLIVTVAANPRNVIPAGNRFFEYLGKISYGIYMYHMIAVYTTSQVFKTSSWWHGHLWLYCVAYYAMALALVLLIAHFSYRWLELPFLRLKERRFSLLPTAPVR
jgi:peptidoglycan/LPS O-acetylase OafA/YrhL